MKTAILFYGLVQRSLRHVAADTRRCLLEPLQKQGEIELYFHSWITGPLTNPRAGEFGCMPEAVDVPEYLPEARGEFDNEADFIAGMDWNEIDRNNPFRRGNQDETAAAVTIRNILCTLRSLERVWEIYSTLSDGNADCVVATRADTRFLNPVAIPDVLPVKTVFIPAFHGWGGVNDRFAFGHPKVMGIYARRRHFYEGTLLQAHRHNPEWVLMKWLQMRLISVQEIELFFQRIRADGSVFHLDRELEGRQDRQV